MAGHGTKSVRQAILADLKTNGPATVKDLAENVSASPSLVFYYLKQLKDRGMAKHWNGKSVFPQIWDVSK